MADVRGPGYEGVRDPDDPRVLRGTVDGFRWRFRGHTRWWTFWASLDPTADDPHRDPWFGPIPHAFVHDEPLPRGGVDWTDDRYVSAAVARGVAAFRAWLAALSPDVLARLPLAAAVRVQQLQAEARR